MGASALSRYCCCLPLGLQHKVRCCADDIKATLYGAGFTAIEPDRAGEVTHCIKKVFEILAIGVFEDF